jgi:nucleotide sugar dehydrogenase
MKNPIIGIVGVGWVGKQLARYFEEIRGYTSGADLMLSDIVPERCAGDIDRAHVIFLTVPTPPNKDGSCDTSIVENALAALRGNKIVVIKSTVPPGTTERLQKQYPEHKLLFNPEFLTESRAWEDMLRPDRQLVGFTEQSLDAAHNVLALLPKAPFMSPWGIGTYKPVRITATEAELIKYAGNVYFSRKVVFANALAKIAAHFGIDYENVRKGMSADHRIGDSHLDVCHDGYRGFGGYCFPKDVAGFMAFAKTIGLDDVQKLVQADWDFNEELLQNQGLTIEDVSKHNINEIEIKELQKKRKQSRA